MTRAKTVRGVLTLLLIGVSPVALLPRAAQAQTQTQTQSQTSGVAEAPVSETNRYHMRMMMQVFDGAREFSHTQVAGFGRIRQGSESWVEVNFGDGAVVVDKGETMQLGRFRNTSSVEAGLRYDYATKTLGGDSPVALYHNRYVRPQLGRGPALGQDAIWSARMTLAELGFSQLGSPAVSVELSRRYFVHEGKALVLLHYKIPSFVYRANGRTIVQWGEGAALTDPGFGQMYWNAAIHRAVAGDGGVSGRPYRMLKTMGAVDAQGRPLLDPRKVPAAAALLDRFYGASAKEVMAFADGGTASQTPIALATKLDIMALSIGEDSANQLGETTGAYTHGQRGAEEMVTFTDPPGAINLNDPANTVSEVLNTTFDSGDKIGAIAEGLASMTEEARPLLAQIEALTQDYQRAKAALEAAPASVELSQGAKTLRNLYNSQKAELAHLDSVFDSLSRTNIKPAPALMNEYARVSNATAETGRQLTQMAMAGETYVPTPSPQQLAIARNMENKVNSMIAVESKLVQVYARAGKLQGMVKALSQSEFANLVGRFGNSPAGKVLSNVASGLNVATTLSAVNNLRTLQTDLGRGQDISLTRDYGTAGSAGMLIFELAALTGNALSGNVKGAVLDAAAIVTGSVTDIIISAKSVKDANRIAREAEMAAYNTELAFLKKRIDMIEAKFGEMDQDLADAKEELENFDKDTDEAAEMSKRLLEERRRAREEHERQVAAEAEAERQRLIQEARAENERIYQENLKRPPTAEEWERFNRDIAEAMKPDYPTAPPPTPEQLAERLRRAEAKRLAQAQAEQAAAAQAAAEAERLAAEEAERKRKAEELAEVQDEAQRKREKEREDSKRRNEEAAKRKLEFEPVTFEPPVWTPPVFDPPEFVPPEFDPPDPSSLDWTNFDDDDYPGGGDNLAYQYEDMSGRVETDLSKWKDWLATQDQRLLERLALQAGYPNLASALADAHNIIGQSRDEGYRRWATQAPSCGGYIGCGPSYLERWAMKSSIVALGDILNRSRDVFSSGGLTDVGVSGTRLDYLLRDHGVQDGDIIDIEITQFGRMLYSDRITLTNQGKDFTIPLQRGVAGLTIFAVNEGTARPNTAQITLDNVVRGEETQQYSLSTGEFATQRIEVGAK